MKVRKFQHGQAVAAIWFEANARECVSIEARKIGMSNGSE